MARPIALVALEHLPSRGAAVGEVFFASPVAAIILKRKGKAVDAPTDPAPLYATRELTADPVSVEDPTPTPRRRRTYKRRDLTAAEPA